MHSSILLVRCLWSDEAASQGPLSFCASAHQVTILAQVGIQAHGLSSTCFCHLGNPSRLARFSFLFAVYTRMALVSRWFVSIRGAGQWVQVWGETSDVQDLREDLPASQRLFGRLHASQSGQEKEKVAQNESTLQLVGLDGVIRRVNTQKLVINTCSGKTTRRRNQFDK